MKTALAAATLALLAPAAAAAHLDVRPGVLAAGEDVELTVELPELRPGPPPTDLEVSGVGVYELSSRAAGRAGAETLWRVLVRVEAAPGPVTLVLRARFEDGSAVEVRRAVTVIPARADGGGVTSWALAGAALALVGLGVAAVLLRRRAGGERVGAS